jgi:CMP-N-acetylneuraminic acid synthetase/spore coat polysaccharide biosynthesis predicted glycosyltransferase SpsG
MTDHIVSIIPARKGSKGIPRKNIRDLGGAPLVAHAITTSREAQLVDSVVLTTDSQEIAQIGRRYGADTVIDRPTELATDEVPLAPVVQHAFSELDGSFDHALCFQPTVPLVSATSIDDGIEAGLDDESGSVIFVRDSTHQYWKRAGETYEPVSTDRKNRQLMDQIYEEIGIFLSSAELVADGRRVGPDPSFHEVPREEGVDIDTYEDWQVAESRLRRTELFYRVIGDDDTGSGHVYRGITIADHLFEHDITFLTEAGNDLAVDALEESNYEYRVVENDDAFLDHVRADTPAVVVNDILDTSAEYVEALTDTGARVVNFEDLGDGTDHADAVINALYEYSDPPANHYFGFNYFCLRNEFRYATPHEEIPSVDRIMISFGGTDENDLTAKTLRALSGCDRELHLDVVLGLGYTRRESLESVVKRLPSNVTIDIDQNVDSMSEHMAHADLLVTSNGRTLYEACSLNLPVISIAQNHREQKHPFAHVSRGVLSLGQANYVTEENILTAIEDYIADEQRRETMRAALSDQDIANGIDRIKRIIFDETNAD